MITIKHPFLLKEKGYIYKLGQLRRPAFIYLYQVIITTAEIILTKLQIFQTSWIYVYSYGFKIFIFSIEYLNKIYQIMNDQSASKVKVIN